MTDEEHRMIADMQAELRRVAGLTDQMHRALLQPGADGTEPFMTRTARVVYAAENGSWGVKWVVRIIISLGGLIVALSAIRGGLK